MRTGRRVLVVDDEPHIVRSLTILLRKRDYEPVSARNGKQAWEAVLHNKPEVILLDVMMPEMDGFELCRALKKDPRFQDIYVIMLTARGQAQDFQRGLAAGANEYLTKPFSPSQLLDRLETIFRGRSGNAKQNLNRAMMWNS